MKLKTRKKRDILRERRRDPSAIYMMRILDNGMIARLWIRKSNRSDSYTTRVK